VIIFPHFPLETGFVAAIGSPLLTDNRNWHTATYLFELQRKAYSAVDTIAASLFHYQLVGLPLSVIGNGRPIELD
jgi:hypothetical protein